MSIDFDAVVVPAIPDIVVLPPPVQFYIDPPAVEVTIESPQLVVPASGPAGPPGPPGPAGPTSLIVLDTDCTTRAGSSASSATRRVYADVTRRRRIMAENKTPEPESQQPTDAPDPKKGADLLADDGPLAAARAAKADAAAEKAKENDK